MLKATPCSEFTTLFVDTDEEFDIKIGSDELRSRFSRRSKKGDKKLQYCACGSRALMMPLL